MHADPPITTVSISTVDATLIVTAICVVGGMILMLAFAAIGLAIGTLFYRRKEKENGEGKYNYSGT